MYKTTLADSLFAVVAGVVSILIPENIIWRGVSLGMSVNVLAILCAFAIGL